MEAQAQTIELTEVAVGASKGLMSGDTNQILGAIIIVLLVYIIYLHKRSDKKDELQREDSKERDGKFTATINKQSEVTDKMSSVLADIAKRVNQ